jgi:hypothetical protein
MKLLAVFFVISQQSGSGTTAKNKSFCMNEPAYFTINYKTY